MDQIVLWNDEKNEWLRANRGLSFELVTEAIVLGEIVDDIPHHNKSRKHQRVLVIRVQGRHVAVPYVTDGDVRFLKTMFYSRTLDEKYGD